MAFKDIPGLGWTVIIVLAMLMGWGIVKFYTGMPGFPDDLKRLVEHVLGVDEEKPADGKEVQGQ